MADHSQENFESQEAIMPLPKNPQKTVKKLPDNAVVCLMAPTASGKTALAYELYDTGRFEIISVDSALIYRDMNIGTAKPTQEELQKYPHHLVNIVDPTETYSVANFVEDVERLIGEIHGRGKIPLLVGGTMMYYMALFTGLSPLPETDMEVRQSVAAWREEVGIEALHNYLKDVDPVIAARLNIGDTQRVTRAVEVYKQTGKPLSYWQGLPKIAIADNLNQCWLGLAVIPDRQWLHKRIKLRLQMMWDEGFFDEVIELLSNYSLTPDTPSMRCVGYRQVIDYLVKTRHEAAASFIPDMKNYENQGNVNSPTQLQVACQDMRNRALYATRQLAKRQYTWLRNIVATHDKMSNNKNDSLVNNNSSMDENSLVDKNGLINKNSRPDYLIEDNAKVVIDFSDIEQAKAFISSYL